MTNEEYDEENGERRKLEQEADAILRGVGLDSTGRPFNRERFQQYKFENRMQLGAYCSRRRK